VLDPSPLSKALLPAMMYYSYVFSTVANMTCRQRRRRGEEGGVIVVMRRRRCSLESVALVGKRHGNTGRLVLSLSGRNG